MPLQTSGAISLSQIQTEFGGTNPISLNEYYSAASGIPASGTISMNQFYGASAVVPFDHTFHTCGIKDWDEGPSIGTCRAYYTALPGRTDTNTFRVQTGFAGFQEYYFQAGTYNIDIVGAPGGSSTVGQTGGHGARLQGTVTLTTGWHTIVAGTRGGEYQYTGGGGGCSMFYKGTFNSPTGGYPIAIAGGGGGGGNSGGNGKNANGTNTIGIAGNGGYSTPGSGGNGAGPAGSAGGWGVGGSGWFSAGTGWQFHASSNSWNYNYDIPERLNNGTGSAASPTNGLTNYDLNGSGSCRGAPGGFPGAGSGQCNGGGGGSGYSGGAPGGGGGGSYWAGNGQIYNVGGIATSSNYLYESGYVRIWS